VVVIPVIIPENPFTGSGIITFEIFEINSTAPLVVVEIPLTIKALKGSGLSY
jgi:hypothetical protein